MPISPPSKHEHCLFRWSGIPSGIWSIATWQISGGRPHFQPESVSWSLFSSFITRKQHVQEVKRSWGSYFCSDAHWDYARVYKCLLHHDQNSITAVNKHRKNANSLDSSLSPLMATTPVLRNLVLSGVLLIPTLLSDMEILKL